MSASQTTQHWSRVSQARHVMARAREERPPSVRRRVRTFSDRLPDENRENVFDKSVIVIDEVHQLLPQFWAAR